VLSAHYLEQDVFGLGGSLWLWKENANDINRSQFWGVYGPPFGPGVPQPERVRLTSRAYPLYLAGNLRRLSYNPSSGRFTLTARARRVAFGDDSRATVVYIPRTVRGRVHVRGARSFSVRWAGARLIYLFPTGGSYWLSS
jgi:hypothetical protein